MTQPPAAARRHPSTTPLDEWPSGWLVMECASLLNAPLFIVLHGHEKEARGWPVTDAQMRAYIAGRRAEGGRSDGG